MTASPILIKPRSIACFIPHLSRASTSSCQCEGSVGFGLGYRHGYTPRYKWAEREVITFRVTVIMGTEGRYFEQSRAVSPLLVNQDFRRKYLVVMTMIALASCSRDAETAAQQTVSVVSVGVGVSVRNSLKSAG
jgi:hypothetical protein